MSNVTQEEQVRQIALFFLFAFMDEKLALQAAQKTVAQMKALQGSGAWPSVPLIRVLRKTFEQMRKLNPKSRPANIPGSVWNLPAGLDLSPWLKFQREASDTEIIAVALSKILRFEDPEIAEGIDVSLGTARYRIGKGVRQLGQAAKAKA